MPFPSYLLNTMLACWSSDHYLLRMGLVVAQVLVNLGHAQLSTLAGSPSLIYGGAFVQDAKRRGPYQR